MPGSLCTCCWWHALPLLADSEWKMPASECKCAAVEQQKRCVRAAVVRDPDAGAASTGTDPETTADADANRGTDPEPDADANTGTDHEPDATDREPDGKAFPF